MTARNTTLAVILVAATLPACDDDVPDNLAKRVLTALAMRSMGCGDAELCGAFDRMPLRTNDTKAQVEEKATTLTSNWCNTWTPAVHQFKANDYGTAESNSTYDLKIMGFGSVKATTGRIKGRVTAVSKGWKVELTHTHQSQGKVGACPKRVPAVQCIMATEVDIEASDAIELTWGAQKGQIKKQTNEQFKTGSPVNWCAREEHPVPLNCSGVSIPDPPPPPPETEPLPPPGGGPPLPPGGGVPPVPEDG